ncbi:hypothetical protein GCM10028819_10790 [Spirosoma humi]
MGAFSLLLVSDLLRHIWAQSKTVALLMMLHKLVNGTLLTPYRAIQGGTVVIGDGQILGIHE